MSGVFWEGHFGHARSGIIVLGRLSFGLDILHPFFSQVDATFCACVGAVVQCLLICTTVFVRFVMRTEHQANVAANNHGSDCPAMAFGSGSHRSDVGIGSVV